MGTFLITGGAGFLGINLTRYLLERDQAIVTFDLQDFDYPERDRVLHVTGDIRDRAAVDAVVQTAIAGGDPKQVVVIHAAAALPRYSAQDIYTTDIDGICTVVDSAFQHAVEVMQNTNEPKNAQP